MPRSKATFADQIASIREGETEKDTDDVRKDIDKIREARSRGEEVVEAGSEREEELRRQSEQVNDDKPDKDEQTTTKDDKPGEQARTSEKESEQAAEQDDTDGNSLTTEEQLELFQKELELERTKRERLEARAQKWETLAQRRAGELGHLRQNLEGSRTRKDESAEGAGSLWDELDDNQTTQEEERRPTQRSVDLNEFEKEALDSARQRALSEFLTGHEDLYIDSDDGEKVLDPLFLEAVNTVREDYGAELASQSPKRVRSATTNLLREARATVRERRLESDIEKVRSKRAIVSKKARERKKAMEATESSATSKETTKQKSFDDLSTEEMRQALVQDKRRTGI